MRLGPVMIDVSALALDADDVRRLSHPQVGGVILFARNFASAEQLRALTAVIHALRDPPLIIAVDHEGGRVQRFRDGFTAIPPMRALGKRWDENSAGALASAREVGWMIGAELAAHGVDFSFAPVLDLDYGASGVIGDRALHHSAPIVAQLAVALIEGLREAGVAAVGKHFPGHGYVRADSHHEVPIDPRSFADIENADLVPFRATCRAGLAGIMPAHVIYPHVDAQPAGYSTVWLKDVLRAQLGFGGLVFSDDLSMEGAKVIGGVAARAQAALSAGCDMVLLCNAPAAADELLAELAYDADISLATRIERMRARRLFAAPAMLRADARYAIATDAITRLA